MSCATLLVISPQFSISNCRFGVVGWSGDDGGRSFCFQCFFLFLIWVRSHGSFSLPIYPSLGAVFKIKAMSRHYALSKGYTLDYVFCSSFVLASTLWCTLFIIYRIVTVTRSAGGLNAYRHVIEVLVESSALYSISLILFVTFYVRHDVISYYFNVLSVITRVHHHSFHVLVSHKRFPGNRSDTPHWARCSWSCSPRRILAGKRRILTSLRNRFRKSKF